MIQADYIHYPLSFIKPAETSRNVLRTRDTYFLMLWDDRDPPDKALLSRGEKTARTGFGEAGIIPGLSPESSDTIRELLDDLKDDFGAGMQKVLEGNFPAVKFALETALLDYNMGGKRIIYSTPFTEGKTAIPINGLVWINTAEEMEREMLEKASASYKCIKMKIGSLDFDAEYALLEKLRSFAPADKLEIRADANGAYSPNEAAEVMTALKKLDVHSIEQPIAPGNPAAMRELIARKILPVSLDEELIGIRGNDAAKSLLEEIRPDYIVLKPSLHDGLSGCERWIARATELGIGYWVTSALESNLGLTAIAQWIASKNPQRTQGLGTGQLYRNNLPSALELSDDGNMTYRPDRCLDVSPLFQ